MAKPDFNAAAFRFTPTFHNDTYPFISPTKLNLSGYTVLITGASRGIGLATAHSYAAAGASQIAVAARSAPTSLVPALLATASAASRPPPQILPLSIDVTSEDSITAAVQLLTSTFSRLDILVNNAGYLESFRPIASSSSSDWWDVMTINLRGPYLLSRAFLPLLLSTESGQKTILNTSSIGALLIRPGASGYQTSKFALMRLTEFLAAEYGAQGLLAVCFHPGGVMTELAKVMPEETHVNLQDKPELAGDTVAWLTGERREWLQGRYFSVNWDMEEFEGMKERVAEGDLLKMKLGV
ncbi:NADP-dependent 3-hydroxy acid dehydrogenase [Sphaceloma murrayae]|uniref:NADP-dependent 3-hydroxy acid dehydrogenase n=1 Tax=Sphaceloma murrayae TaxID=2082308 RepID=A0A2K1QV68_9PEZI|nr:NADP-dependent 3-hydroxy acid dehydrogenase [Sphaceloma murrayae]